MVQVALLVNAPPPAIEDQVGENKLELVERESVSGRLRRVNWSVKSRGSEAAMTDGGRVRGGGGGGSGEARGGTTLFPAETCRRHLACREPPGLLPLSADNIDPAGLTSGLRRGDPGVEVRRRSSALDEGDVPTGRAAALDLLAE